MSGGNDRAKYYVSGRFFTQDGIYSAGDERYTQYNLRSRGEIKINDQLTLENSTDFTRFDSHQPMVMYDRQNIARQIQHQGYPVTMEKNPDGTWTEAAVYIGWAGFVEGTSWQKNNKLDLRNTTTLTYVPIKDQLTFKGDFSYYSSKSGRRRAENMYDYYTGPDIKKTRNTYSSLENVDYNKEYISSPGTMCLSSRTQTIISTSCWDGIWNVRAMKPLPLTAVGCFIRQNPVLA